MIRALLSPTGKLKSIGVSNFGIPLLKQLATSTSVVPATNQVELHPCLPLEDLRTYSKEHGIILTAYSPIGRPTEGQKLPTFLVDEPVKGIAARLGATPAQVVLSWMVQQDIIVVPKSESDERQKANITVRPSAPITSSPSADNYANTL
jgi:glycerol 2-dehydrogenase (NADP+)